MQPHSKRKVKGHPQKIHVNGKHESASLLKYWHIILVGVVLTFLAKIKICNSDAESSFGEEKDLTKKQWLSPTVPKDKIEVLV